MFTFLLIVLVLDSFVLIGAVLLQAGTGGGLAAMGGGASTDSFMGGRQAATILTRSTWWLGGIFLGLALMLAGMSTRTAVPRSVLDTQQQTAPAPIAPPPQLPLDVEPQSQQAPPQDPN